MKYNRSIALNLVQAVLTRILSLQGDVIWSVFSTLFFNIAGPEKDFRQIYIFDNPDSEPKMSELRELALKNCVYCPRASSVKFAVKM